MRILLTANSAWNLLNFRFGLIEAFLADGHEVHVLAPEDSSLSKLASLGCKTHLFTMDVKGLNPLRDIYVLLQFWWRFRAIQPNVIFGFTIKNNIYGSLAARALRFKFVPNVSGLGTAFMKQGLIQRIAKLLYRESFAKCPTVFFQNDDDQELFLYEGLIRKSQVRLLPGSGIDLQKFALTPMPSADTPLTFLMIARLIRDKGVYEFVEAARIVKKENPHIRFQLLGGFAENRSALATATVQAWHDEGVIEYLGETSDVRPFIAAAHCVVLPSYREGAPRSLIEAAAMGRPCIATDVPGCRAVVEHGVTGYLCEAKNSASLANAIYSLISLNVDNLKEMHFNSRARAENTFDQELIIKAYKNIVIILPDVSASNFNS